MGNTFEWAIRVHQWTGAELAVVGLVFLLLASLFIDFVVEAAWNAWRRRRARRDLRGGPGNYAAPATRHHAEQR